MNDEAIAGIRRPLIAPAWRSRAASILAWSMRPISFQPVFAKDSEDIGAKDIAALRNEITALRQTLAQSR